MEERVGRDEILRRLETERNWLLDTVSGLTPSQLAQPWVVGAWSVKDVLAHLVYWNVFVVQEIEAAVNGAVFKHPSGTTDEINAWAVDRYGGLKPDVVLVGFRASYNQVVEAVQILPGDALRAGQLD